jgi:two-component system response regulator FixJ
MKHLNIATDESRGQTVYVVDDDANVRDSLCFLLNTNCFSPLTFESGSNLLATLPVLEPGCVLLDARMPQIDGLQVMAALQERGCHWPIIVMTGHGDVPMAVQAMKLGAFEFIEKPFTEGVMCDAITRALDALHKTERQRLANAEAATRLASLTPRERQVLDGLMAGAQNKIVAHRLALSVRTVELHRANLLSKLDVRTVQEAAVIAARAQIPAAS